MLNSSQALTQEIVQPFSAHTQLPVPVWAVGVLVAFILLAVAVAVDYVRNLRYKLAAIESDLARSAAEWSYAMDFLEDPMYLVDLDDRLIRANRAFYNQIGKSPEQALGHDVRSLIHLKPEKIPCPGCAARLERRDAFFTKEADDPTNPTGRPIEVTIRVVKDDLGKPIGIFQGLRDLSHLRQTEQALRESQNRLANAQRIASVGNWDWDVKKDELIGSAELYNIFGMDPAENPISMETLIERLPLQDQSSLRTAITHAIETGTAFRLDHQLVLSQGKRRYVHQETQVNLDKDGKVKSLSGTAQDVTDRQLAEKALFEEKEKAQVTLRSIGDAVLTTDRNGIVEYANPATERLLELNAAAIVGKSYDEVIGVYDSTTRTSKANPIELCLKNQTPEVMDEHSLIISHNGHEHVVDITVAPIHANSGYSNSGFSNDGFSNSKVSNNGELNGCVLVAHDVTEMHNMARKLNYQATHDELTGLINRREFEIRLSQALENAHIDSQQHALIYMDMDNFKIVNDTCGHLAGDELLKQFCALIKIHVRSTDTFARLGGDEFALLLVGCPIQQAKNIAAEIQHRVQEYRFQWNERSFEIGVSMGITLITEASGSGADVLNNADSACYVAKNAGRNLIHVYNDNDVVVQQHRGEMQWVQRITQALADERFTLFCQSIQSLAVSDDNLQHFEILVRMVDEQGNLIGPQNFIPAAERYQLMTTIDRWVINAAFTMLAAHNATHERLWNFSINLSGQSLSDPELLEYIIETQNKVGLNPHWVCFEITETAAVTNLSEAKKFINFLKQSGFRFALDDFGSGMSSFAYLRELDIDFLKIDGSFVKQIDQNRIDYAMVSSINQIGQLMGLQTIAEFVENDHILELIKALQIDFAQGYGIDKPRPLQFPHDSKLKQHAS
ncbi:MAG: EAL domain-containing protein [Gammaproteobacteria bacterium]|nr:EAL domain-containing protein [Gammaproteobacteria bacterium]